MMFEYDEEELAAVAVVVIKFNKHAADLSVPDMVASMKRTVEASLDSELGYVSTRGYVMTAYLADDGRIGIKASVSHHLF